MRLSGILLSKTGLLRLGPPPSARVFVKSVLPCALSFAGTLWLGNWAYLKLSMSFIQMLKVRSVSRAACETTAHHI